MLWLVAAALAQSTSDDARARELYDNGAILYEEGRYEDAIVAFQEAYRLSDRPALLFNIANAQERAGQWNAAMETLSRYRAWAPEEERETLDRRIRNIERRIDENKADPPPPAPVATAPAPAPVARKATLLRPVPVVLGSVGVVGLGLGAGFGLAALDARREAGTLCAAGDAGTYCPAEAQGALARDREGALAADISFGVGAAGLLAGVAVGLWGAGGPLAVGPGWVAWESRF